MSVHLSPLTWRFLGLNVAAGYICLGCIGIFQPTLAAKLLVVHPESEDLTNSTSATAQSGDTTTNHEKTVSTSMLLLGARDLSIGVALAVLSRERMPRAMGILINSGMILCAVDCWWIWKATGSAWGLLFVAGAASWGIIGYGLLGLSEAESW